MPTNFLFLVERMHTIFLFIRVCGPNKDIPNQSELLVDDTDHEGGVMYHTMPTSSSAKKRKVAHNHGKAYAWPGIICSYPVTTTWIIGQVCSEALEY